MPSDDEYEISYTITHAGEEVGFGAASWSSLDGALEHIAADIQRREWETEPGMPDPETVDAP